MNTIRNIRASGEDYLEGILVLQKQNGYVRSVDLARYMGFSKPSISYAVKTLRKSGYLLVDEDGGLELTPIGLEIAEKIYERHLFFTQWLMDAGISPVTAEREACQLEHAISQESFELLREAYSSSRLAG